MSTKILGIFGQKENGKTTVRKYITSQLLRSHILYHRAFSGLVKDVTEVITGHNSEYLDSIKTHTLHGYKCTVRECYQKVGTLIRSINPTLLIDDALEADETQPNLIIDDGRFPEEVDEIHRRGGKCLLIVRPNKLNSDPHETESWSGNVARHYYKLHKKNKEINISTFDSVVYNDGSLEQLYKGIDSILPELSNFFVSFKK